MIFLSGFTQRVGAHRGMIKQNHPAKIGLKREKNKIIKDIVDYYYCGKNCKQRLIYSPPITTDAQKPSKLNVI